MAADDWENPHPCDEDPEELETIWNMHNCIWLTVGSIMQQGERILIDRQVYYYFTYRLIFIIGCDILPK